MVNRSRGESRSRGRRFSALFELRGFWAIADQGVVSLGNFLTTIILARTFSPEVYGLWTVLFAFVLFLNVIHASLIAYPLSVKVAAQAEPDAETETQSLINGSLWLTAALTVPLGLLLFGASYALGTPALGLWACLAFFFWQLQETTRRALMARLSFRKALWSDAISYLGQAGLIWALARGGRLSPELCFAVIALTCGVAAVVQAFLLKLRVGLPRDGRELAGSFWAAGHWVLWSGLATSFSIQAVPWSLFLISGAREAAGFQAVSNLLGVSHPIMLSLGNILVPAAARARATEGLRAARRVALTHAAQGGLLLLPYFAALMLFPELLLKLFYGSDSPYLSLDGVLPLFAALYALHYVSLALKFWLNALEQNRQQFKAEMAGSLLLALALAPLVFVYGLMGAVYAMGAWLAARLVGNALIVSRVKV